LSAEKAITATALSCLLIFVVPYVAGRGVAEISFQGVGGGANFNDIEKSVGYLKSSISILGPSSLPPPPPLPPLQSSTFYIIRHFLNWKCYARAFMDYANGSYSFESKKFY
jgi:hypothetical protein